MSYFVIALTAVLFLAWLLFRALVQFRAFEIIPAQDVTAPTDKATSSIDIIVPARNEESNIRKCIDALRRQKGLTSTAITVVDDNSTDYTAAVVQRIAEYDPSVRLINAGELPETWTGKSHACWKGALGSRSEWLCFVDADAVAAPALVRSAVAYAEANDIDLLSLQPSQILVSFWERLLLPAGFLLVAVIGDLRVVNDETRGEGCAVGQFILIRRKVYEAVGGHAAIRQEIAEDAALAREVKRAGYRAILRGADQLLHVRLYTGLRDLWEGVSKNVVDIVGGTGCAIAYSLSALFFTALMLLLPIWGWQSFAAGGDALFRAGLILAMTGTITFFSTCVAATRYFRIPPWYGILTAAGFVIFVAVACNAVRMRWTGQVRWKGRLYTTIPSPGNGGESVAPARPGNG